MIERFPPSNPQKSLKYAFSGFRPFARVTMLFDFAHIDTQNRYKLLSFTVVPRPIAWVVTLGRDGRRNAAPFSFFNVMTSDPPIVALGITARPPKGKDTPRIIEETREFVVNLVPHALVDAMNITGAEFDPSVDELAEAALDVLPSAKVKPPRIANSPVAIECSLREMIKLESGQRIVLGNVLAVHVADEAVIDASKCYVDTAKLDLVGRLNNRYMRTDGGFDLPRVVAADWMAAKGEK